MGKDAMVPAALVRGVSADAPLGRASDLVRTREDDLFRESPLVSLSARRTIRSFGEGDVPRDVIEEAVTGSTVPVPPPARELATILFVDIVTSTRIARELGDRTWRELLSRFNACVEQAVRAGGGQGRVVSIDPAGALIHRV